MKRNPVITRRKLLGSAGFGLVLLGGSWAVKSAASSGAQHAVPTHSMDMTAPGAKADDDPKDKKGRRWKLKKKNDDEEYMLEVGDTMPDHHFFMGNKKHGYYSHGLSFGQRYDKPKDLRKALIEAYNLELFEV